MTAKGFYRHLTGGGEAAHLIVNRELFCIQCRCCSLQHATLIWWITLILTYSLSSSMPCSHFLSPSFIRCPSSFPPFTLLITPSFFLPRFCSFFLINIFSYEGYETSLQDKWMKMNDEAKQVSLSLSFSLLFVFSFTWSWLCFLWCTFEANENAASGGRWVLSQD